MKSIPNSEVLIATQQWYREYHAKHGGVDRNSIRHNPEVDFQYLAMLAGVIRALRSIGYDPSWRVLDVGCGNGGTLIPFLVMGAFSANLTGIDILPDSIETAKHRLPGAIFLAQDASNMAFEAGHFDITCESTMFMQLTDEALAARIAAEMVRVTKPQGHILLVDWRYDGGRKEYRALSPSRIDTLFQVGSATTVARRERGALLPPIGRKLSKYAPWLYFPVHAILPFLSAQCVTILRKI